jgi:hypothetical protein
LVAILALATLATTTCTEKQALTRPSAIAPLGAVASVVPGDDSGSGVTTIPWRCFAAGADGPLAPPADPACTTQHPSSPTRLVTRSAPLSAPGAPTNFGHAVIGNDVSLGWTAAVGGEPPTSYWIEAGSTPGGTDLIAGGGVDTANLDRAFVALGVPTGTYYVRVRAKNAAGLSAPSPSSPLNEVPLRVGTSGPCAAAPGPPTSFSSFPSGSSVNLVWAAPVGGCAPTEYVLQYGTTAGSFPNSFATGNTNTSYTANNVPDSTFYVRGMAKNGYGTSAVSNATTFAIRNAPGPAPAPTPCTECTRILDLTVAGCDNQYGSYGSINFNAWIQCTNIATANWTLCLNSCR